MKSHCIYGSDDCNKCKLMNTKELWEEDFKWFLGSEELTKEVKDFIRETREQAKKEERDKILEILWNTSSAMITEALQMISKQ